MARGQRSEHDDARVVSMDAFKERKRREMMGAHPAASGGGKKPPKTPKTEQVWEDPDPTPSKGMPRPEWSERESRDDKYKNGWYN
jgi:hypothetical protein